MNAPAATSSPLDPLFAAERAVRDAHAALVKTPADELTKILDGATKEALALADDAEKALRLRRIVDLLSEIPGPGPVDLLVDVFASEEPESRYAAGEALETIAFDRFKELALGVERALARFPKGSRALSEIPYLLAEVPEPGVTKILGKFLQHSDPEAVGAAIEALVEIGDPEAVKLVAPLAKDARTVAVEDEEGESQTVTIGELAAEAVGLFREIAGAATGNHKAQPGGGGKGGGGKGGGGGGSGAPRGGGRR